MIFNFRTFILFCFFSYIFMIKILISEPLIVLEYATSKDLNASESAVNAGINEEKGKYYKVKKDESLSGIVEKFYGKMGLNLSIVQTAVVYHNKHAFVRNNPNFMYANKRLYLPSIKDIKNLVYKKKRKTKNKESNGTQVKDIYFFGG